MNHEALDDLRAATAAHFLRAGVRNSYSRQAIALGHIPISFTHLAFDTLRLRRWAEIKSGNDAFNGNKRSRTNDLNTLELFLNARSDTVVLTKHDQTLWWACFGAEEVLQAEAYRYRPTLRGWHRLERDGTALRAEELPLELGTCLSFRAFRCSRSLSVLQQLVLHELHVPSRQPQQRTWAASAKELARNAFAAAAQSGKDRSGKRRIKGIEFESRAALEDEVERLLEMQGGRCKLTGIELVRHGVACTALEKERLPSLDRIRSDGNYSAPNLQIVCRFINRWKSALDDAHVMHLLDMVRSQRLID